MSHAARQPWSWLIFDVRQTFTPMKSTKTITIIGILGLLAIAGVTLRGQAGANQPPPVAASSTNVYFIVLITIRDRAEFTKYTQGFRAIFSKYKGDVLVADEDPL